MLKHHGAIDGVTGSCHELTLTDGRSVLVDCGLFQGAETAADGAGAEQLAVTFPVDRVAALIVTHIHIDHVGRIPYLLAAGFQGPILCKRGVGGAVAAGAGGCAEGGVHARCRAD